MAITDKVEWKLYDTDLTHVLGILAVKEQSGLSMPLNEPGSGVLKIHRDSNAAAVITSGMFLEASYRGDVRGGFFVENIGDDEVNSAENAGKILSISGRGPMIVLDDAIVDHDGTSATTRNFSATTKADILITLIEEAKDRGCFSNLTYDFTDTLDSNGDAWDDSMPLVFNVGTSLLEVVRQLAKSGMDFEVLPDGSGGFVLSAYKNGLGADKSTTIFMRVGENCQELSSLEDGNGIKNVLRLKYNEGFTKVSDSVSIAARRRRETLVDVSYAGNSEVAQTFGQAELEFRKDPKKTLSVRVFDGKGPRAFVSYRVGDTITLDRKGVKASYRIRGIQPVWVGDNFADIQLDLNSIILENEIRMGQDVAWLKNVWETAHDAGLINASFWAQIGASDNNGNVLAMCIIGTKLYVGGSFTRIGGIDANYIAVYDLLTRKWDAVGTGVSGTAGGGSTSIYAMAAIGSVLYFGGNFSNVNGSSGFGCLASYNGSTFSSMSGGMSLRVRSLCAIGSTLYIGGEFNHLGGDTAYAFICSWNGSSYSPLNRGVTSTVFALAANGSTLYLGGQFSKAKNDAIPANNITVNGVCAWTGVLFVAMGSPAGVGASGEVQALCVAGNYLYVGGTFTSAGGITVSNLSRWHLVNLAWSDVGGGVDDDVFCIVTDGINVYIGGSFNTAGENNIEANYIVKWNLGDFIALGSGVDINNVHSIALYGLDVIVGGGFNNAGGKPSKRIAIFMTTFSAIADYLDQNGGSFDLAKAIHAATAETAFAASDEMGFWDAGTGLLRKITWTNTLASIKTYTDTLYVALTGNQTVAGIKTFSSFPVTPSSLPSSNYEVANKLYVDTAVAPLTSLSANRVPTTNASGVLQTDSHLFYDNTFHSVYLGGDPSLLSYAGNHILGVTNVGENARLVLTTISDTISHANRMLAVRGAGSSLSAITHVLNTTIIAEWVGQIFYDDLGSLSGTQIAIKFLTVEDQSSTNRGNKITFSTTPLASTTLTEVMSLANDGSSMTSIFSITKTGMTSGPLLGIYPTFTDIAGTTAGQYITTIFNPSSNNSQQISALDLTLDLQGSFNKTGNKRVLYLHPLISGSGSVNNIRGIQLDPSFTGAVTLTQFIGFLIQPPTYSGGAAGVNHYGIYIANQGNAAITGGENIALFIDSITGSGSTMWALKTATGLIQFGDYVFVDGSGDRVQMRVQGNATQTSNIFAVENSSASVLASINNSGDMTIVGQFTISNTAPIFVMTDTTASAKSLTVKTDANKTNMRESAGADGSLFVLDLTNNRVGIKTNSPGFDFEVNGNSNFVQQARFQAGSIYFTSNTSTVMNGSGNQATVKIRNNSATTNAFIGYDFEDSSAFVVAAIALKQIDLTNHYGQLFFSTKGSAGHTTKLIIDEAGNITIGTAVGTARLQVNGSSDIVQSIFKANATQTNDIMQHQDSSGNIHNRFNVAHASNTYENVFNEQGSPNIDFRVETDTYNAIFVDASNESIVIMSNAAGKVGFFGVTAVAQQTELTDEFTTITHTAPGTPDYAIQDFVDVSLGAGWAFKDHDEANSLLKVVANLQTRVNELETKLVAYGLLVDAD